MNIVFMIVLGFLLNNLIEKLMVFLVFLFIFFVIFVLNVCEFYVVICVRGIFNFVFKGEKK